MTKKIKSFLIVFISAIILFGCQSKEMKKAKEFMEASMYDQAISLLEIEIQDNPKNAEANYLLGKCYIETSKKGKVEECFNRTILLDTEYKEKVGNLYFDKSFELFQNDNYQYANSYYEEGLKYNLTYKDEFAKKLFDYINDYSKTTTETEKTITIYKIVNNISPNFKIETSENTYNLAKSFIEKGFVEQGLEYAEFSIQYDSKHIKDVADIYFNHGNNLLTIQNKPNESIYYFDKCMQLNPQRKSEIGNTYYNQAKIFETNNDINLLMVFAQKSAEINPDYNSWYFEIKEKFKPKIPLDNLIAYYPFNGNANDESGNKNDGSVSGARLTVDRAGKPNSAYYFDGANDYINIRNGYFSSQKPKGTVNFWFKPIGGFVNLRPEYINLIGVVGGSGKNFNIFIYNGKLRFANDNNSIDGITTLWDENWYMVTVTWDYNSRKIYLNAMLENEDYYSKGHKSSDSQSAYIGKFNIYSNGEKVIDEVSLWSRVLSEEEIAYLFSTDLNVNF